MTLSCHPRRMNSFTEMPEFVFLSDLVTQATVVVKESSVSVECHVPNKQIPALLDEAMAAGEAAKKQ